MKCPNLICAFSIVFIAFPVLAQDELDSLLLEEDIDFSILSEDSLLLDELDSLSIFVLLDSILNTDYRQSQLALRVGFTSNVVNAGRDLGLSQQGLMPGISYYHKTGPFLSASGYWNSQFDPKYNLTVLSAGYLGQIGTGFIYSLSYEHSFFANSSVIENDPLAEDVAEILDINLEPVFENPLTDNLSGGLMYDFKWFYTGLDYSFFFGKETAHRLDWRLTGDFKKKGFIGIDRISFNPSFTILAGNENITTARFNDQAANEALDSKLKKQIAFAIIRDLGQERFFRRLDRRQKETYLRNIVAPFAEEVIQSIPQNSRSFGIMNFGLSVPVTLREGRWSYTMGYNYNFPIELPGENLDLSPSGYFSFSLTYYISF